MIVQKMCCSIVILNVGLFLLEFSSLSNSYYFENIPRGGLAPSSQTVGFLLILLAGKASWENDPNIAPMDSKNTKI
jgi:hypothetical protein